MSDLHHAVPAHAELLGLRLLQLREAVVESRVLQLLLHLADDDLDKLQTELIIYLSSFGDSALQ